MSPAGRAGRLLLALVLRAIYKRKPGQHPAPPRADDVAAGHFFAARFSAASEMRV